MNCLNPRRQATAPATVELEWRHTPAKPGRSVESYDLWLDELSFARNRIEAFFASATVVYACNRWHWRTVTGQGHEAEALLAMDAAERSLGVTRVVAKRV